MPFGDPAGYLPNVKRRRRRNTGKTLPGPVGPNPHRVKTPPPAGAKLGGAPRGGNRAIGGALQVPGASKRAARDMRADLVSKYRSRKKRLGS